MRILGIDPGKVNMALCLLDEKGPDTWKLKAIEHESNAYRLYDLEQQLGKNIPKDLDLIVHEGISFMEKFGVAESGMVQYLIQRQCIQNNIQFITVSPATLKRFLNIKNVKGEKTSNKTALTLAVYKKYKLEFPSQDECDAFILAQIGMAVLRKEFELTAPKPPKKPKKIKEKK
jgi:hypothetical protein